MKEVLEAVVLGGIAFFITRAFVRDTAREVYHEEEAKRAALFARRADDCACNTPNAGLPLTGDEICRVCRKKV